MAKRRECPSCRSVYSGDDKLFCPKDGTRLVEQVVRASEDPWIGRVIAGRFVLERRLGKGGMGVVYLANHNVLKRPFAVKLLRREFVSNERALARFFREARVASSVDHPNIVSIYDYGQTDKGEPYLVMEYVEGTLLYQLVIGSPSKCLHPLQAVDISLQVARALEHAHNRGVVHRDIKPENILIATVAGQPDFVKVLDFGVARVIGQPPLTRVGEEIIGTPEFIAPEMMSASGELSPSVDLYALGIMLHDTVVGEPPWRGDIKEILQGHMNVVPPRLSDRRRNAAIPRELDELTAQLLEKNPARRPTATETVESLTRIRALMPSRSVQLLRGEQAGTAPPAGESVLAGKETVVLPAKPSGEIKPGQETVILPRPESNAAARQAEIEAIDAEIVTFLARLAGLVDGLGQKLWFDTWPDKAQLLRELLAGNSKAQEKRQQRIKLLSEQVQLQQSRLQEHRSELRQQILALSERLQLEMELPESERHRVRRAIEDKERLLAQVLFSAPTSPEPELYRLRRELRELTEQARVGWPQLARLVIADPRTDKLSERATIELVLEQLSAAQAMQALLHRQGAAI
jgi:serine/threonine protein kinase